MLLKGIFKMTKIKKISLLIITSAVAILSMFIYYKHWQKKHPATYWDNLEYDIPIESGTF